MTIPYREIYDRIRAEKCTRAFIETMLMKFETSKFIFIELDKPSNIRTPNQILITALIFNFNMKTEHCMAKDKCLKKY